MPTRNTPALPKVEVPLTELAKEDQLLQSIERGELRPRVRHPFRFRMAPSVRCNSTSASHSLHVGLRGDDHSANAHDHFQNHGGGRSGRGRVDDVDAL